MNRRTAIILMAVGALLVFGAIESYVYMDDQRQAAQDEQSGAVRCRDMAVKIKQLGQRPALAAEAEQGESEMNTLIEKAADAAGVSAEACVSGIRPQEPRPIANSAYKEKPTQLLLHKVTMEQLVRMAYALVTSSAQLHIKSMSLAVTPDETGQRTWTAQLDLTYLIYDSSQERK